MPTRANAIGRYDGLAPELQDTLRRNGMQARLVQRDGDVLLAVQGHDSPLLTYPLSQSHLKALTDGGTNSSNRKAYDAFAAVVGADFHLPKSPWAFTATGSARASTAGPSVLSWTSGHGGACSAGLPGSRKDTTSGA